MEQIKENEYSIKACNTCSVQNVNIDINRIRKKMDEYFDKKDFFNVERLLNYWIKEAENSDNKRAELELHNEYMGYSRKQNQKEEAFKHANRAKDLVDLLDIKNTISAGTIYLNIATVHKAFNDNKKAIEFFEIAKKNYDENLKSDDRLYAGLYNNMALAYVAEKRFDEAYDLYNKAIEILSKTGRDELDIAISFLNLADLINEKSKIENTEPKQIEEYVNKAYELLTKKNIVNDEYYRFVCEKCAPTMYYYGYFALGQEIEKRSKDYGCNSVN